MGVFLIMHHGMILILNDLNHLAEARHFSASHCIVVISKGNTIFPWSPGHWLKWRLHSAQLQAAAGLGGQM